MTTRLLSLRVRNRRDLLLVRHRTRQLASLLGFCPDDQAILAAGAFETSRRARQMTGRATLHFDVAAGKLVVSPEVECADKLAPCPRGKETLLRLERALPPEQPDLGTQDIPGIVKQIMQLTPLDVFKEIERQNLELLRVAALRHREELAAPTLADNAEPNAA